ncbi:class II glutamine amidotransferase [Aureimonas flava]|uniref:Class II glutamine amidotransferase n=1 Tax=Aureimonas flava TaxID=2320271 RepID=A0A3A1WWJ7_9HYPH|nr:class II glutamine amidotransferase [Aureimonas flava]RIY02758.1 class II glutamine amidotransferase [Aureimonas flava]
MCRLLAYLGTPLFLEDLLIRPAGSLVSQSLAAREARTVVNGDGCGLGWYGERPEPGLYRGVLPAWSDANLASLCRQIRSGLFLAHVRAATSGGVSTANCHPFALGSRLFMHNGQIGDYGRLRRQVEGMIPDAAYASRTGTCDSEALFLAALAHGLEEDPARAFARTLAAVEALKGPGAEPTRFAAVYSDGRRLLAFRWASDGQPPSLYSRHDAGGVMIASEPCGADPLAWVAMPSGSLLEAGLGGAWLRAFDVGAEAPARRAA